MELGTIQKEIGNYILKACDAVLVSNKCINDFISDVYQGGAGTSVNMNANEVIANIALELKGHKKGEYHIINPNDHVNKSQSTNCAYPTGFRIAVYSSVMNLIKSIEYLQHEIDEKAMIQRHSENGPNSASGCCPMTVGQEFHAYSTLLKEELKNIKNTVDLLLEVNLGATAIGTGLNAIEGYQELAVHYLAEFTGFNCTPAEDLIEATSDCGAYVTVHAALKRLAVKLSKVCNDLRLLSSGPRAGLNEINLPELQAGSSIMPAKVNPVIPEVVNQVCFKVIGNDTTVTFAAEAGQLQLNVMEPVIGQAIFESISLLNNACLTLADKCIKGITVNREICENYVLNSIGIVTYLNPFIGHHEGDIVGKICAQTGKSVREVVLERKLLGEAELDQILSASNFMQPKYTANLYK
ncbi:aspartate ammonia-lyase [Vibrio salinus]|uniref:aspartate ammonia-lyase n=1 Tax=Vibrio salinus TaxID=2899784 RepID=UPI001E57006F|nr:aspartate ammonia-lyase [Vibrio salinus]MCE0494856.1 aspartate ammonia-lyase [Vibrio salinus]